MSEEGDRVKCSEPKRYQKVEATPCERRVGPKKQLEAKKFCKNSKEMNRDVLAEKVNEKQFGGQQKEAKLRERIR